MNNDKGISQYMKVLFKNIEDEKELGYVSYNNIVETLIPAFKEGAHDMFIDKIFKTKKDFKTWQIMTIQVADELITIQLSPIEKPESLGVFARSQNKKPKTYLRKFNLVEVDFGFYTDIISKGVQPSQNHFYTSGLLSGEIHKKRPCIVLDVNDSTIQVIPLSTKDGDSRNKMNVPLSELSFSKLSERYTEKKSSALIGMIQTVSYCRVFPLKFANGKYQHNYVQSSVSATDKDALKLALARQYNKEIERKIVILTSQVSSLRTERMTLLRKNEEYKAQQTQLTDFIHKVGDYFDYEKDLQSIIDNFSKESGI